jgi:membrane fusion protein, copper/silver efflux system
VEVTVKKTIPVLVLILMALSGFIGWRMAPKHNDSKSGTESILHYMCPMHPQYISDRPGDCPSCGMRLVPADTQDKSPLEKGSMLPAGALSISAERQQIIGMRTAEIEKVPIDYRVRTVGRVAADETKIVRMTAADGWVEEVFPNAADNVVRKDQLLAKFYSKDLLPVELSFLYTLDAPDRSSKERQDRSISYLQSRSADKELRSLGMSDVQMKAIAQTRLPVTEIELRAPITGFVLARNINAGMKIDKGAELYRIADLNRVWILADLFENEASYFLPGMEATVTMRQQGKTFRARVSSVLPQFDPVTRTLKVRLETDNPGYALRPDMFVDVEIPVHRAPAVAVFSDAIIDTGSSKRVYVDLGDGHFAPREVKTGMRFGDRTEIVDGLAPGERIVTSGAFLIDSESRMKSDTVPSAMPVAEKTAPVKDLVCGMDVDPKAKNPISAQSGGKTYYFCSEKCKKDFQANPKKYIQENMAAQTTGGMADRQ